LSVDKVIIIIEFENSFKLPKLGVGGCASSARLANSLTSCWLLQQIVLHINVTRARFQSVKMDHLVLAFPLNLFDSLGGFILAHHCSLVE